MCHDSAVAHDRAPGAPATEIEITPEMIEAGAEALRDGSNFGNELSPSVAAYFSKRVIRAALDQVSHGTL